LLAGVRQRIDSQRIGILCVVGAWVCFSTQDMAIKWISDHYALHQITLTRSVIAMLFTLLLFMPMEGGYHLIRTRRPMLQILRGVLVVFSNFFFFSAIVVISLGEAMAIFFVAPLLITLLSIVVLKETIGWRRIVAVVVGFAGVLVMLKPGSDGFKLAALLPLLAALCYASAQITARKIGQVESASTLAFYIQLVFITASVAVGIAVGDGRYADVDNPSLRFLFRAWHWPQGIDLFIFLFIGILSGIGAYLISQGYRLCEAGVAAPFEYVALPLAVMWSIVIWGDWPAPLSWLGIFLIAAAGLYIFFRENVRKDYIVAARPLAKHK